ncbi:MAG: type II toxin-antitoxin system PemK/MazF family toxin [Anaerolineae bacterium]|nr:type II toxin-antitoxin system PemK/MazF family toxin [Anaerolineae bacterium]
MDIKQGNIYWLQSTARGAETSYAHPYVVIQDDVINRSRVKTVVVCALTTNKKRVTEPGNVLLEVGEANLPRQSIVVVSQVDSVEKTALGEYIGSLSKQRVEQIFAGMRFQQLSYFAR